MAEKQFEFLNRNGARCARLATDDLPAVELPVPYVLKDQFFKGRFQEVVKVAIRKSCPLGDICVASALVLSKDGTTLDEKPVHEIWAMCRRSNCPHGEQPPSDDTEPLDPVGPLPLLAAEADLQDTADQQSILL